MANELQGAVKCVRVDTTDIDEIEQSLMDELGVTDSPTIVAAYIEDGNPKAFRSFTPDFDYKSIYDACVELFAGNGYFLIFH